MATKAFAPAKVNLTLHVTGQRPDGYHLLDSLVVFVDIGDHISVAPAKDLSLTVTGPRAAGVPSGPENLVLRAASVLPKGQGAAITLQKHLPAAAGIGGGSSDAAATLRALSALWGVDLPADRGLGLGADVPVCLAARPCRMQGVGDVIRDIPALPPFWMVLVNPGVAVPTPAVFAALRDKNNVPMAPVPAGLDVAAFCAWLGDQRNDLALPACAIAPEISEALAAINAQNGCLLARMSGSGATCFGIFADQAEAQEAAMALKCSAPDWWVGHAGLYQPEFAVG